ncbi:N/A [soil metagenome]
MDLIGFLKILNKRKYIIAAVPLLSLVIAFFLTKNIPQVYRAQSQIATGITDEKKISLTTDEKGIGSFDDIQSRFSNLIEIIKSKQILDLVSYRLVIHDISDPPPFSAKSKVLSELNKEAKDNVVRVLKNKIDSAVSLSYQNDDERGMIKLLESLGYDDGSILKKLKVDRLGSSDFIQIVFESENPYFSSFVVNTISEEFIDFNTKIASQRTDKSVSYFSELAEQKKRELSDKVNDLKVYKQQHRVINIYEQTKSLVNQISEMEVLREKENKQIPSLNKAITDIDSRFSVKDRKYLEAGNSPYNLKISELKDKITDYSAKLTGKGYSADAINDSLKSLKNSLNTEVLKGSDEFSYNPDVPKQDLVKKRIDYQLDLIISQNSVQSIDKDLGRLYSDVVNFAPLEASISALEREIQVASDVYLLVLNKLNMAKFDTYITGSLKQIEYGQPGAPESSKRILMILLSGVISLVLTIVAIFVLEYFDMSIKNPVKFSRYTSLNLIGFLNQLKEGKVNLNHVFSTGNNTGDEETFKELLRTLRYEITGKIFKGSSVLFTSTENSEGKTLIISSLAYSLSLTGKRILIIDTNFKNNSLTRNFKAKPLLEEYFNSANENLKVNDIITHSSINGIDIIGCKGGNYSINEIGDEENISEVLNMLKNEYDYIFLEGSSLNKYVDSKELIKFTDYIIPVFSASSTLRESDKISISYLRSLKEKNLGGILNKIDLENLKDVYGKPKNTNKKLFKKAA